MDAAKGIQDLLHVGVDRFTRGVVLQTHRIDDLLFRRLVLQAVDDERSGLVAAYNAVERFMSERHQELRIVDILYDKIGSQFHILSP